MLSKASWPSKTLAKPVVSHEMQLPKSLKLSCWQSSLIDQCIIAPPCGLLLDARGQQCARAVLQLHVRAQCTALRDKFVQTLDCRRMLGLVTG